VTRADGGSRRAAARFACIALIGALALTAGAADAGSIGRAEFIKRADNLCQPQRNDAKRRVANGTRLLTKKHPRIQAAGREFARAYRELRGGYERVSRLPRPGADHKRIAKWLHREREATGAGVDSAIALRHRHFAKARRLSRKAAGLEQAAARAVRNFDFKHCRPL
jgi:uncharacterized protein HemX